MSRLPSRDPPWARLRQLTPARIALGRSGISLPTTQQLAFQLAHARARDAVHCPLEVAAIRQSLQERGWPTLALHSAAGDRPIYLQRPDQGRCLDAPSRQTLVDFSSAGAEIAFVIADGLSALAVQQHAVPLLDAVVPRLQQEGWTIAPVVVVEQGRVAVGDEIGVLLKALLVVVLIGERPGLSSPDSMGIYLSHSPRVGMKDAERNCISNIRPAGLAVAAAAETLRYLLDEARRRGLSGVLLKDESAESASAARLVGGNFLIDSG